MRNPHALFIRQHGKPNGKFSLVVDVFEPDLQVRVPHAPIFQLFGVFARRGQLRVCPMQLAL
jgi:hypothetical protein